MVVKTDRFFLEQFFDVPERRRAWEPLHSDVDDPSLVQNVSHVGAVQIAVRVAVDHVSALALSVKGCDSVMAQNAHVAIYVGFYVVGTEHDPLFGVDLVDVPFQTLENLLGSSGVVSEEKVHRLKVEHLEVIDEFALAVVAEQHVAEVEDDALVRNPLIPPLYEGGIVLLKRLEAPLDVKGLGPALALLAKVHIGPKEDIVFLVCYLDRLVKKVFHVYSGVTRTYP